MNISKKKNQEKKIVKYMIELYCKKNHKTTRKKKLCSECLELLNYAFERTEKCPFIETKTFCSNCSVHCYKKDMKEKIKKIMRFSGKRMIFSHPILALKHVISMKIEKIKLEKNK